MVGRRTAGACVIAVGMISVVAGQKEESRDQCPPGATCRERVNPVEAVCSPVLPGPDGLLRYTVFFDTDDRSQIDAFLLAMDMWNSYSSVTGIRFDRASDKSDKKKAHLQLHEGEMSRDPANRACTLYESGGSSISFSAPLMNWARSSPKIAARAYGHELGHALALDHFPRKNQPSSIMHEGPEQETDCREVAETHLTDVQLTDAEFAQMCASRVRAECQKDGLRELLEHLLKSKFNEFYP